MNEQLFKKWLTEEKKKEPEKNKNFYVLVGPPAVGKTSWIADFIESQSETFVVLSRDQIIEDQIFPKYKFSNNELYTIAPPKDAEVGKKIDGMENFGKVIMDKKGRKAFEHILRANAEVEETLKKEIKGALRIEPENIIVDAINATERERAVSLDIVKDKPNYKKIAIYFEFKPYQDQIKDRAAKRAMNLRKELGKQFDRTIPDKVYETIFNRITIPHISEGFDEVYAYDSFKKVKKDTMDITAESLVKKFRNYLADEEKEEEILSEARLNKVWRQRAKARAKRHDREYPNKIDKSWAIKQQAKWNKEHPELEEEYLREIENAQNLTSSTKIYLEKLKAARKAKLKAKFEKPTGKKRKTLPSPYAGEGPETEKFPYKKGRTGGVAKVYQKRIKRISGAGAAPGETIGPGLGAGGIQESPDIQKSIEEEIKQEKQLNEISLDIVPQMYNSFKAALPDLNSARNFVNILKQKIPNFNFNFLLSNASEILKVFNQLKSATSMNEVKVVTPGKYVVRKPGWGASGEIYKILTQENAAVAGIAVLLFQLHQMKYGGPPPDTESLNEIFQIIAGGKKLDFEKMKRLITKMFE